MAAHRVARRWRLKLCRRAGLHCLHMKASSIYANNYSIFDSGALVLRSEAKKPNEACIPVARRSPSCEKDTDRIGHSSRVIARALSSSRASQMLTTASAPPTAKFCKSLQNVLYLYHSDRIRGLFLI